MNFQQAFFVAGTAFLYAMIVGYTWIGSKGSPFGGRLIGFLGFTTGLTAIVAGIAWVITWIV